MILSAHATASQLQHTMAWSQIEVEL